MNNNEPLHIFGEVLFDHFPDGSRVLGGAPFNVAWHLQALGLSPRFISRIGDDASGQEVAALMDYWGMRKEAMHLGHEHPTGSVRVLIEEGEPHYDIIAECAYDFIDSQFVEEKGTQGILYHGTLALRNPVARSALQTIKASHHGKIFVDINLRPPWWERESVLPLLRDAHWVKLNEAELFQLCPEPSGLEPAMWSCCERFDLDLLVVTRGAKGAVACGRRHDFIAVKPAESTPVVDTVGAGDAFAAIVLMGLSKQWAMALTLERAQAFASTLVGKRGATVCDGLFYRSFNEQWR
ncbi:MAG: carbohydrate kinase [Methylomicrobium sp.]|nr:carbohydrate kinase [Methylomicrobium sp.]